MSLPRTPFGKVCHLVNGKAFKPTDWSSAGIPIIRIQNLNGPDKPFNHWLGPLDKQVLVKTGDLLLAWSGTPGTSFGAHIWSGPNGVLNQHIFRCDLDQKAVTKEWARIAVNHRLHRLIEQAHGGVGLQHVTRGMVEELEIPLPPLPEQRRIAEVLDKAEALRARRRSALAELGMLTQSVFLDMFGDPAINPKGWPTTSLERVISIPLRNGLSPSKSGKVNAKVLTLSAITGNGFDASAWKTSTFMVPPPANQSVQALDFLICRGNGNVRLVGKGHFPPAALPDTTFPDTMIAARISPERIERAFLQHVWNSPAVRNQIESLARTTNGAFKVNQPSLEGITFIVPQLPLQREFVRRVNAVEKLKTAQRQYLAELDALFASLQHRAFRGEL